MQQQCRRQCPAARVTLLDIPSYHHSCLTRIGVQNFGINPQTVEIRDPNNLSKKCGRFCLSKKYHSKKLCSSQVEFQPKKTSETPKELLYGAREILDNVLFLRHQLMKAVEAA